MQPDRGCCWWSTHTRSDRSVQSFSVESQFSDSNNVGPRLWWPNHPPNIRKFWSTATAKQRPASCGGGCGCWSPYTGILVEVAVGNCGCDWRSLSWMGPLTYTQIRCCYLPPRNSLHRHQNNILTVHDDMGGRLALWYHIYGSLWTAKNRQRNSLITENILSFHQFNRPPISSWTVTVNCFDVYALW